MSASKRTDTMSQIHKVLGKHYKPIKSVERPVLEQLLYACCLEDSRPELADECFARLQESFFDWNEVRVTTVHELAEVLRGLSDSERAATSIKHTLHSVFEAIYAFDLESLKKQNLGAAVKQLQGYRGTTPFSVSYTVQHSLGGHSIPVSRTGMEIMRILGVVTDKNIAQGIVPGLERAISKNKGAEFGSLLQQFTADYAASPFSNPLRAILLEIEPEAKDRFPKRGGRKATPEVTEKPKKEAKQKSAKVPPKTVSKPASKKKPEKKKPTPAEERPKKKAAPPKAKKSIGKKASTGAKKSTSKQLARRKPR